MTARIARRAVLAGLASWALAMPVDGHAAPERAPGVEPVTAASAMHLAVLAERTAKLHAQAGHAIQADRSRRALAESIREFDAALRVAQARAQGAEARDSYQLLALLWQDYRPWLARAPNRDNLRRIAERTEELAWVATKAARLTSARDEQGLLAAQAAQAAMLSQRVAKLHLLLRWDPLDESLARDLAVASGELHDLLDRLGSSAANTPEIAAELQVARTQYEFMARAAHELRAGAAGARALENVAKTGDHILESMQRLARLYDALARMP